VTYRLPYRGWKHRFTSIYTCIFKIQNVFYQSGTWSLTLKEEHRLRVFENRVLRRIFRSKRVEVRSLRKLHNEELHNLYSSPNMIIMNKSRRIR
jgi:hypothetical protein